MYFFRGAISHFSKLPYGTFQNYDIALFRTPISHFSTLRYRTFQNYHIALFRTPISHFSELSYRTFQNYDIALFRTTISHFSELSYRTFQNSHIALFRTTISHFLTSYTGFSPACGIGGGRSFGKDRKAVGWPLSERTGGAAAFDLAASFSSDLARRRDCPAAVGCLAYAWGHSRNKRRAERRPPRRVSNLMAIRLTFLLFL